MAKPSVFFVRTKTNKNSLMALCGAIEKDPSLEDFRVKVVADVDWIESDEKAIVAFSFMTSDVPEVKGKLAELKRRTRGKEVILIAGGSHPSGAPEQTLKMGFDYCFVGEGEESLVSFLLDWQKDELPGQRIIRSKPVDITRYPAVSSKFNLFGPIEITRGCPFGCYFCQTSYLFGRMRHRTIDQIVWAAQQMADRGSGNVRFVTPNLLAYGSEDGRKPNLEELERMLVAVRRAKGVKRIFAGSFPSEIRPEQITKKALGMIKKHCDNDNIIIGAQSGSDRMLKACHRGHTVKDVWRAVELTLEIGFKINIDFIFGMPGETLEGEKETIKMIEELIKKPGVRIHSHYFMPLPGTPWAKEKPTRISPRLREFLLDLRTRGKEYGDWQEQERVAKLL